MSGSILGSRGVPMYVRFVSYPDALHQHVIFKVQDFILFKGCKFLENLYFVRSHGLQIIILSISTSI